MSGSECDLVPFPSLLGNDAIEKGTKQSHKSVPAARTFDPRHPDISDGPVIASKRPLLVKNSSVLLDNNCPRSSSVAQEDLGLNEGNRGDKYVGPEIRFQSKDVNLTGDDDGSPGNDDDSTDLVTSPRTNASVRFSEDASPRRSRNSIGPKHRRTDIIFGPTKSMASLNMETVANPSPRPSDFESRPTTNNLRSKMSTLAATHNRNCLNAAVSNKGNGLISTRKSPRYHSPTLKAPSVKIEYVDPNHTLKDKTLIEYDRVQHGKTRDFTEETVVDEATALWVVENYLQPLFDRCGLYAKIDKKTVARLKGTTESSKDGENPRMPKLKSKRKVPESALVKAALAQVTGNSFKEQQMREEVLSASAQKLPSIFDKEKKLGETQRGDKRQGANQSDTEMQSDQVFAELPQSYQASSDQFGNGERPSPKKSPNRPIPVGRAFVHELRVSDKLVTKLQSLKGELARVDALQSECKEEKAGLRKQLECDQGELNDLLLIVKSDRFRLINFTENHRRKRENCRKLQEEIKKLNKQIEAELKKRQVLDKNFRSHDAEFIELQDKLARKSHSTNQTRIDNNSLAFNVRNAHLAVQSLERRAQRSRRRGVPKDHDRAKNHTATSNRYEVLSGHLHDLKEGLEANLAIIVENRNILDSSRLNLIAENDLLATRKSNKIFEEEELVIKNHEAVKEALNEKDGVRKERDKLEMKVKDLSHDRDTLKQRLKKFRSRRLKFEQEHKTCKNCNKEYIESENYNWSCRMHQSEFGGELWWCCGKVGKEAIGCKFLKHESKDDEDDLDDQERAEREERESRMRNLKTKCYSCKEVGHMSKNCPRDPNLRSAYDVVPECQRVESLHLLSKKSVVRTKPKLLLEKIETKLGYETWCEDVETVINPCEDVIQLCQKTAEKFNSLIAQKEEEDEEEEEEDSDEFLSESEEDSDEEEEEEEDSSSSSSTNKLQESSKSSSAADDRRSTGTDES